MSVQLSENDVELIRDKAITAFWDSVGSQLNEMGVKVDTLVPKGDPLVLDMFDRTGEHIIRDFLYHNTDVVPQ